MKIIFNKYQLTCVFITFGLLGVHETLSWLLVFYLFLVCLEIMKFCLGYLYFIFFLVCLEIMKFCLGLENLIKYLNYAWMVVVILIDIRITFFHFVSVFLLEKVSILLNFYLIQIKSICILNIQCFFLKRSI